MTAAVYRTNTPSCSIPQTQNTAPVLQFNCLFTHDLRQKRKRWHDGFLCFHTFNNRIMVYDTARNSVGDAHWRESRPLQDGDEIQLEKGGVLVQVAESVGSTETDLTELRNSRKKAVVEEGSLPNVKASHVPLQTPRATISHSAAPLKHRSLNAVLGTPKGRLGKAALPSKSPFEERQELEGQDELHNDRLTKRPRLEQQSTWTISRTTNAVKPRAQIASPLWARTADARKKKPAKAKPEQDQQRLGTREIIDLCEDDDEPQEKFLNGFSSDALAPESSPQKSHVESAASGLVRSSSPAFQIQEAPAGFGRNATSETSKARSNVDRATNADLDSSGGIRQKDKASASRSTDIAGERLDSAKTPLRKSSRSLRLAAGATKRKGLLCQDQLSKAIRPPTSQSRKLDGRLAKIDVKERRMRVHETSHAGQDEPIVTCPAEPVVQASHGASARPQTPVDSPQERTAVFRDNKVAPPKSPVSIQPAAIMPTVPSPRKLRRAVSENPPRSDERPRRPFGAPTRITPSPAKKGSASRFLHASAKSPTETHKKDPPSRANTKVRQPPKRAASLSVLPSGTSAVLLSRPFQAPKAAGTVEPPPAPAKEPEPWSREAFDLFEWRPPAWDEANWCVNIDVESAAVVA